MRETILPAARSISLDTGQWTVPLISTVVAYVYFCTVRYSTALWREFNCVKIPQGEANKSANRWGNLRAKGGVVTPSVFNLASSREHQI